MNANRSRIIVALDYPDAAAAWVLLDGIDPQRCRVKVGKELFTRAGPAFVKELVTRGYSVFLDLKFHDIPNTVARACAAAADLGVWMVNVHTLGGRKMMAAAREAMDQAGTGALLIGVTVLTSLGDEDLAEVGLAGSPADNVQRLATLAKDSGLNGVVCSPQEAGLLSSSLGRDFVLVTPGIRPASAEVGDQKRITTPADALRAGSHYLVIGRPITAAPEPMAALAAIEAEVDGALGS